MREVVITSLRKIAQKHVGIVLKDAVAYRMRNPKVKNVLMGLYTCFSHGINLTELNLLIGIFQRMGEKQQISVCLVFFVDHYYSVSSLVDIFLDKREKKERKLGALIILW